ncbi:Bbp16 family capsid cement protein [Pseudothauera rhizosphaerae]|uniref:Uncharacterized protein n=1 Tax=Pseudothauera rhizosphaerae TaxID=2565932 RepID=A0A4S4AWP2_9RHOO|nr:hypothetical protein [Pseudothauera rhizosphaerae]THF64317.1 hypothetical protein E6O51_03125 [Pseudothauera rhizosphaerae]
MIIDERNEFADATALSTAGTGRALVGDVIDLGAVPGDIGNGEDLYLVIQVDTAVTSGGSATVAFELVSDEQAAIAADGSATVHFATGAIPKASLVAGYVAAAVKLPLGTYERYLGVIANVGTAALTAGKINAFLTPEVAKWQAYADAA